MNKILKSLENWGARPDEALRRMLGDDRFYFKLINTFIEELDDDELSSLVVEKKFHDAFVIAHRMKGSATDLGLAPLFYALSAVTEDLRDQDNIKNTLSYDLEQVDVRREELKKIMSEE